MKHNVPHFYLLLYLQKLKSFGLVGGSSEGEHLWSSSKEKAFNFFEPLSPSFEALGKES